MSKKRVIGPGEKIMLTQECSAVIQKKLPPKLKDPGSFSIPCTIGHIDIARALCDLGASVSLMPLTMCKRLGGVELKPTSMTLQLADRSVKQPIGILDNVLVRVQHCYIPVDFIVIDMEDDYEVPIILGRPFLATAGALIDVKNGKLSLHIGEDKIEFDLFKSRKPPDRYGQMCMVEALDEVIEAPGEVPEEEPPVRLDTHELDDNWIEPGIEQMRLENPKEDHLFLLGASHIGEPVTESFPDEHMLVVNKVVTTTPWYADLEKFISAEFKSNMRQKLLREARHDMWDDPHLYRVGADGVIDPGGTFKANSQRAKQYLGEERLYLLKDAVD